MNENRHCPELSLEFLGRAHPSEIAKREAAMAGGKVSQPPNRKVDALTSDARKTILLLQGVIS